MSANNKTVPTDASVGAYLKKIKDPVRREQCDRLDALMRKVTRREPKMWGSSIVGYGSYHYVYDSGREGDMCLVGFSSRAKEITVYIVDGFSERGELMETLGPHRIGKSCLYIKDLDKIDMKVMSRLLRASVATMRKRYKCS
ncbi:MAG: DUF1801 domain-containing protein [Pseudomonadota bacterium]